VTAPRSPVVSDLVRHWNEIFAAKDDPQLGWYEADVAAVGIAGGLPRPAWWDFQLPPLSLATLGMILPYSLILAGVGLIESLMTPTPVDP